MTPPVLIAGTERTIFNTKGYSGAIDLAITQRCMVQSGDTWDTCELAVDNTAAISNGGTWLRTVVPVPAAVWLFGSALGLLGLMTRRWK
jgi:hypothetical protein